MILSASVKIATKISPYVKFSEVLRVSPDYISREDFTTIPNKTIGATQYEDCCIYSWKALYEHPKSTKLRKSVSIHSSIRESSGKHGYFYFKGHQCNLFSIQYYSIKSRFTPQTPHLLLKCFVSKQLRLGYIVLQSKHCLNYFENKYRPILWSIV